VTALLTIDDLSTAPLVRRDRWGRYLVLPPECGKPVGYTRATTVAKALDDASSLTAWAKRMVAIGLHDRADLLAQVGTVRDDKRALNQLCERAAEAGGATTRRDLGTTIHALVERAIQTGEAPTGPHAADVQAVLDCIARLGYRVHSCELMVVNDRHRIAGTADLILEDSGGYCIIADLKTGSSVNYGALSWAVQLGIYATADAAYTQGPADDGSEDQRRPLPNIDTTTAMILHCEPGSGVCTPHHLNLNTGLSALSVALNVRELRKAKPLGPWPEPTPEQADPAALADVAARIDAIKAAGHVADLARLWPEGVATLKNNPTPTADELEQITDAVGNVEAIHAMPFPDAARPVEAIAPTVPTPVPLVAGDDPRIARMAEQYRNLPTDLQANVDAVRTQHQVPRLTSGNATETHLDLVRAALDEARSDADARYVTAKAHWDVFHQLKRPAMAATGHDRPAVKACQLAGIGDEGIIRATAACVENLGLLADAWEAGHIAQNPDTGELVTTPKCVAAVKERHGRSTLRLARKHGATLDLDPFDSTDQALTHPLIAAHLALA
jgi:hypothetical protein